MEQRYRALRTIGSIFRVVGYIILVLTILASVAICGLSVVSGSLMQSVSQDFGVSSTGAGFLGGLFGGLLLGILTILYGGMVALMLVALGESIYLLIGIEENTRKTTLLMESMNRVPAGDAKPLPPPEIAP